MEENRHLSPGSPESSKKIIPKRSIPRHDIIKMPKVKERNHKSSKRKTSRYMQENLHETTSIFLSRTFAGEKGVALTYSTC